MLYKVQREGAFIQQPHSYQGLEQTGLHLQMLIKVLAFVKGMLMHRTEPTFTFINLANSPVIPDSLTKSHIRSVEISRF